MNWFASDSINNSSDTDGDYKRGKSAVLDHLVPLKERTEDIPAVLLQDDEDVNHEQLACIRDVWQQATDRASEAQELWGLATLQTFENGFAQIVREQTPDARDAQKRSEILQAIDEIVQTGLPDYPGLCIKPYGSYVSGLYCPSGDLDLSVEGIPTGGRAKGTSVKSIGKGGKADLLRTVSRKLEARRLHSGWIERILHARVPILKFTIHDVACDVSIGSTNAIFKAKAFRALAAREPRFADMLRLVKAWANVHGLNNAAEGTFNSFALGLMLIFHMQTCDEPVLPPLHELFEDSCSAISSRPIHMGSDISWHKLEVFESCLQRHPISSNRQGLAQLMCTFFNRYHAALLAWRDDKHAASARASTWCGRWSYGVWKKNYIAAVEDPFDATDNCARTIGISRIDCIVDAFGNAAAVMNAVRDDAGVETAMDYLFRGIAPPSLPPVPNVELRQSNSQKGEQMLSEEEQTYARDNGCNGRKKERGICKASSSTVGLSSHQPPAQQAERLRREQTYPRNNGRNGRRERWRPDKSNGTDGHSSQADSSPAASSTLRVPKFARQMQGAGMPQSSGPHPGLQPRAMPAYLQTPSSTSSSSHQNRSMSRASQGLAPSLNSMQGPAQLPSASIAQSGVAQLDMSSLGITQSPPSGQAGRRPPPGFDARSGSFDLGSSPAIASRSGNPNASPQTQSSQHAVHHEAARNAFMQRFVPARDHVADIRDQHVSIQVTQDGAARANAAQHRQAAPVPHYIQDQRERGAPVPHYIQDQRERGAPVPHYVQSQRANQAMTDELKRMFKIGVSSATATSPASHSASAHAITGGESTTAGSATTKRPRKRPQQPRPAKQAQQGAAPFQNSTTAASRSSAVETNREPKARKPASNQGRSSGKTLPIKSAAAAFVENDLSASTNQRKPRKALPVAVR